MRNGYVRRRDAMASNNINNPSKTRNNVAAGDRAPGDSNWTAPRDMRMSENGNAVSGAPRGNGGSSLIRKTHSLVNKCVTEMTTVPEDLKDKPREKIRFHTVKAKEKKPLPVSFIFIAVIFTLLLTYMLYDMVRINEFTIQVAKMNTQLSALEDEKRELAVAVDAKNDLIAIEERAKELGMVKKDSVDKRHINTEGEDKIEMRTEKKSREISGLFTLMDSLGENLRGIMEYIN